MITHRQRMLDCLAYSGPDRIPVVYHPSPAGLYVHGQKLLDWYADRYHRLGGGGIFYIEMENDAPFENVRALIEAIHRYR